MVNYVVTQYKTGSQAGINALETAIEAVVNTKRIMVVPMHARGADGTTLLIVGDTFV